MAMSDDGNNSGIELTDAVTGIGDEKTSTSPSSSSSSSNRGNVYAKLDLGTKVFSPNTECRECKNVAEGVLIGENPTEVEGGEMLEAVPMCKHHRRELEAKSRYNIDNYQYKTFK